MYVASEKHIHACVVFACKGIMAPLKRVARNRPADLKDYFGQVTVSASLRHLKRCRDEAKTLREVSTFNFEELSQENRSRKDETFPAFPVHARRVHGISESCSDFDRPTLLLDLRSQFSYSSGSILLVLAFSFSF